MTITSTFDNQADATADANNLADYGELAGWESEIFEFPDAMVVTIQREFPDDDDDWGQRTVRAIYVREWRESLGPTDRWCRTIETLGWTVPNLPEGQKRRAEDFDVKPVVVPNDVTWRDLLGEDPKAVLR